MLTAKLVQALHELDHLDKLRVIQLLVNDLTAETEALIPSGTQYEIWSPHDAPEAAQALLNILAEE